MDTPESALGKKMLDFERQQVKDGKRDPLPCDLVLVKPKLSPRSKMVLEVLKKLGRASSDQVSKRCDTPTTVNQAASALRTLANHGMVKKIIIKPRRDFGPNNLYEVIDNES